MTVYGRFLINMDRYVLLIEKDKGYNIYVGKTYFLSGLGGDVSVITRDEIKMK